MAKWLCFIVAMLLLILNIGVSEKWKVSDYGGNFDERNIEAISTAGELDQKQEKADGYVKISQQYWYAQGFKPNKCGLDGIDLLMARKGIASYGNGIAYIVISMLSKFIFEIFRIKLVLNLCGCRDLNPGISRGRALCYQTTSHPPIYVYIFKIIYFVVKILW